LARVFYRCYHPRVVLARFLAGSTGGAHVPPSGLDQDVGVGVSSLLSITLVPVLMPLFIRGRCALNRKPCGRITQAVISPSYAGVAALETANRDQSDLSGGDLPLYFKLGSQFMPACTRISPVHATALPGISIQQASLLMQEQDRIIGPFRSGSVFGTVGRSDSATAMRRLTCTHTIMLRPQENGDRV